jgi:hypothetical protein
MSGSRSHAPAFPTRLQSSALAGGVVQAGRPVTPKGPLTALVAQQTAAAAATAGSISLVQVRSGGAVLFFFICCFGSMIVLLRLCCSGSRQHRSFPKQLRPLAACIGCCERVLPQQRQLAQYFCLLK